MSQLSSSPRSSSLSSQSSRSPITVAAEDLQAPRMQPSLFRAVQPFGAAHVADFLNAVRIKYQAGKQELEAAQRNIIGSTPLPPCLTESMQRFLNSTEDITANEAQTLLDNLPNDLSEDFTQICNSAEMLSSLQQDSLNQKGLTISLLILGTLLAVASILLFPPVGLFSTPHVVSTLLLVGALASFLLPIVLNHGAAKKEVTVKKEDDAKKVLLEIAERAFKRALISGYDDKLAESIRLQFLPPLQDGLDTLQMLKAIQTQDAHHIADIYTDLLHQYTQTANLLQVHPNAKVKEGIPATAYFRAAELLTILSAMSADRLPTSNS